MFGWYRIGASEDIQPQHKISTSGTIYTNSDSIYDIDILPDTYKHCGQ